jgi:hypothetical protein
MSDRTVSTAAALLVALGLTAGGWLAGRGLAEARRADRVVTVKGISERPVTADIAIWPLRLVVGDNDLASAQARLAAQVERVQAFLARNGLDSSQVVRQGYVVTDAYANSYGNPGSVVNRYVIRQTLIVRGESPTTMMAASQKVGELVREGVVLSSGEEYGSGGPTFVFTGLNALKPEMIAEATARAREAAEQFARDAGSGIGGIRRASQGIFEILPRDQAPGIEERAQVEKTVRVVSTIEYLLKE